jgi:mannosyltransferase OCH1-like enzyme
MDLDFEVNHCLDELFYTDSDVYLVASGNLSGYITNSLMASKPGAQLWIDVLNEIKRSHEEPEWWWIGRHIIVMNTTGPIMLNRVAKNGRHVYATLPKLRVMPCSVCELTADGCTKEGAFLTALEGSSWVSAETHVYNFFMCRWMWILGFLLLLGVIFFLYLLWRLVIRYIVHPDD